MRITRTHDIHPHTYTKRSGFVAPKDVFMLELRNTKVKKKLVNIAQTKVASLTVRANLHFKPRVVPPKTRRAVFVSPNL